MSETQIVAILFTDLEGSTDKWSRYGEAMARSLEIHDDLAASVFEMRGAKATEHTGDGSMAVFASVGEAIEAARDLVRRMASVDWPIGEPLRLRMGIHVGPAQHRDENFFGTAVSRAARIADAANAGQVLLSTTAHLAARDLLPDHDATNVGPVSLKGLEGEEVVYHLSGDPFGPPSTPRSARTTGRTLPVAPTRLVGRRREIRHVLDLLGDHRLVTLTGVGGVGKTRLALAAAETVGSDALLVDLGPIGPTEVVSAFTSAAGVSPLQEASLASLLAALADRQILVVADNCEHVMEDVAEVIEPLLTNAPRVRVLTTSREPIGSPGEQVYRVPSLPIDESVELFVDRASSVGRDIDDLEKAAEICRRLDGIPLAIELAAARTAHIDLDDLGGRLDERFRILTGGRRGVERQRTLEAVMSWSYELLEPDDRHALWAATVFVGSFDLEAFAAVAGLDVFEGLDRVGSLVDKSLLAMSSGASTETRYTALETVRLYGLMKAAEAGAVDGLAASHAVCFRERAALSEGEHLQSPWESYTGRQVTDAENHRAALEWFRDQDDLGSLGRAAAGILLRLGLNVADHGCRYLERPEVVEVLDGHDRDAYLVASAANANFRGQWRAQGDFAALALESARDPRLRAIASALLAQIEALEGKPVDHLVESALAGLDDSDRQLAAMVRGRVTDGRLGRGDAASSIALLEELAGEGEFVALVDVAKAYVMLDRFDDALAAARFHRSHRESAPALADFIDHQIGAHIAAHTDRQRAIAELIAADQALRRQYDALNEAELLVAAAALAGAKGDYRHAARLLAATQRSFRTPGGFGLYAHVRDLVREHVDSETVAQARTAAADSTPHEAWVRELERLRPEL